MANQRTPAGAAVQRPALTHAITAAVMDELAEQGYVRLTMEGVARRAGVGKSALYRRWPSKVAMVTAALAVSAVPPEPLAVSGDPRQDLRALLRTSLAWLSDPRVRAVLPDLLAESQHDPLLAEATSAYISGPRRQWAAHALAEPPYRGRLTELQVSLLLDLAAAPLFWRLTHGRPVDEQTVDALVDLLVDPFPPTPDSRPT